MTPTTLQLSSAESIALRKLALQTGKTEEELLHEAVAQLLLRATPSAWQQAVRAAQGIWRDRTDLPDFEELRAEGNRYPAI
ncbi:MAG: CopG family transcriptional regulator [Hymenobacter sp.]|nr:CopG family transcriptional regulator [Hymenobacter sp.]